MTKPNGIKTRIFLDGGNPNETREIIALLGFLDGQTTNPTLISRNPEAKKRLDRGERFSEKEIFNFYQQVVQEISRLIPQGTRGLTKLFKSHYAAVRRGALLISTS